MTIFPKINIILLSLVIIGAFSSCSFDNDVKYLPRTQVGYFLYQDSPSSTKGILKMEDSFIEREWQESWGLSGNQLGDIATFENQLWVSDVIENEILQINPTSGLIQSKKALSGLTPNYICAGENYMLISDTSQNLLGFWNIKQDELIEYKLQATPTFAIYRSQKFFLVYDHTKIIIYQEQALSPIDSLDFKYRITDLQNDNGLYTIVFGREGSQNFQGFIDYNTNTFSTPSQETTIIKARYSPYNRQVYGYEFIFDFILNQDRRIRFIEDVQDFEVDFFEGKMYFVKDDSLSVFNHWTREVQSIIPFRHKLNASFFYVD